MKRLLGYSSIAHAGYLMLGVAALNRDGSAAILYYLLGYLFTLGAAFVVICLVCRESDDIGTLAGLNQRSPFLAAGDGDGDGFAGGQFRRWRDLPANCFCSCRWWNMPPSTPPIIGWPSWRSLAWSFPWPTILA